MITLSSKISINLNKREIYKICELKNTEWNYGIKSQISWFKKKIKSQDVHNLLWINNKLCGYTCLRKRICLIKKKKQKYLLFDTLVIDKNTRKKGLGNLLMIFNNNIIIQKKSFSFLVCKSKTLDFYKKNNWIKMLKNDYKIIENSYKNQHGHIFNYRYKKNKKFVFWLDQ